MVINIRTLVGGNAVWNTMMRLYILHVAFPVGYSVLAGSVQFLFSASRGHLKIFYVFFKIIISKQIRSSDIVSGEQFLV